MYEKKISISCTKDKAQTPRTLNLILTTSASFTREQKINKIINKGGGLLRPYKALKLNNFKTVKAMTTKFTDFS